MILHIKRNKTNKQIGWSFLTTQSWCLFTSVPNNMMGNFKILSFRYKKNKVLGGQI